MTYTLHFTAHSLPADGVVSPYAVVFLENPSTKALEKIGETVSHWVIA
jgi:hypothetical protein